MNQRFPVVVIIMTFLIVFGMNLTVAAVGEGMDLFPSVATRGGARWLDELCQQRPASFEAIHPLSVSDALCGMEVRPVTLRLPSGEAVVLELLVAEASEERQAGYQHIGVDVMAKTGMLFLFPQPTTGGFHMCNVEAPLEIFWFRSDGTLVDSQRMQPGGRIPAAMCRDVYVPTVDDPYMYALELSPEMLASITDTQEGPKEIELVVEPWMRTLRLSDMAWRPVVSGLSEPLQVVAVPGDPDVIAVVEKVGRIRIIDNDRLLPRPLLDLTGRVSQGFEQGLLSVAFHPEFQANRTFFVNYTDVKGDTLIVRYETRVDDRFVADEATARTIMHIAQPAANHNGGMMAFGPDGYLYIGTGDGGGAGDPWNNAQNMKSLLGKMLRIDVDGGDPYAIPTDNPFVEETGVPGEIWALGLRNPWRFSFDRKTGDLWIADVGQNRWEEINYVPYGEGAGVNFGWNMMEGAACYKTPCDPGGLFMPQMTYGHSQVNGCSVTGGYRYRGKAIPELGGAYIFGDYCSGEIWAAWPKEGPVVDGKRVKPWEMVSLSRTNIQISSFGEDSAGELYVTDLRRGIVYRLEAIGARR